MQQIITSPPFGSYFRDHRTTPVLGSYTLEKRSGRTLKIAQFVLDNIRYPVPGGWRNRIELRNPGICSIDFLDEQFIYSFVGLKDQDWETIYYILLEKSQRGQTVEVNLGCQNVHRYGIAPATLRRLCEEFTVIAKLPSGENTLPTAEMCAAAGVQHLHVANTVRDAFAAGSLSGFPAKAANLPLVEQIAREFPDVPIIGGGGIYQWQDLIDYRNAGATRFSLATIWFRPWKAREIINRFELEA